MGRRNSFAAAAISAVATCAAAEASPNGHHEAPCATARQTIPAGQIVGAHDLEAAPCAGVRVRGALHYDRVHRVVRAARDLPAGAFLGRLLVTDAAGLEKNTMLVLKMTAGPVKIARQVRAAQPSQGAAYIFIESEDGQFFRAPSSIVKTSDGAVP